MEIERRLFPRVKYPDDCRPELLIKQKEGEVKQYEVVDISEKGIGLKGEDLSGLQPKSRIEAQIIFTDGRLLAVEGELLRVSKNNAGIYLTKGIPFSRITMEQILLRD